MSPMDIKPASKSNVNSINENKHTASEERSAAKIFMEGVCSLGLRGNGWCAGRTTFGVGCDGKNSRPFQSARSASCSRATRPVHDLDALHSGHWASLSNENRVRSTHPERLSCWRTSGRQSSFPYIAVRIARLVCHDTRHCIGSPGFSSQDAWLFQCHIATIRMEGNA